MRLASVLLVFLILAACEKAPDQPAPPKVEAPPPYSVENDPARAEYAKLEDLMNSSSITGSGNDEAKSAIQAFFEKYPKSPFPFIAAAEYSRLIASAGAPVSPQEISLLIDKASEITKDIPEIYVVSGLLALDQNQVNAAQTNARSAQKLAPDNPSVLGLLGRTAAANREFDDAEKYYKRYLEVSGKPARMANIHVWLGRMYEKKEPPDLDTADAAYAEAVKLDSGDASKHYAHGKFLLTQRGDYENAKPKFLSAIALRNNAGFEQWIGYSEFAKWADFYQAKGAHYKQIGSKSTRLANPRLADLKKISEAAGISPEDFFVEAASYPGLDYVLAAFIKAKAVTNLDYTTTGSCGCTALTRAAREENSQAIKFLLANGANVDSADVNGNTALHILAYQGSSETMKLLLDKGATINVANKSGRTPFEVAYWGKRSPETIKLLVDKKVSIDTPVAGPQSILVTAVLAKDSEMVSFALKLGANPNQPVHPSIPDMGVITEAVQQGSLNIVDALLAAGANPWKVHPGSLEIAQKGAPAVYASIMKAREGTPAPAVAPTAQPVK